VPWLCIFAVTCFCLIFIMFFIQCGLVFFLLTFLHFCLL
jgi:hypothetical protein